MDIRDFNECLARNGSLSVIVRVGIRQYKGEVSSEVEKDDCGFLVYPFEGTSGEEKIVARIRFEDILWVEEE